MEDYTILRRSRQHAQEHAPRIANTLPMTRPETPPDTNGTQRIEAFSDGIFAIAITLLILEIHVPHTRDGGPVPSLAASLAHLGPAYFAYIFSFVMIGIYWANHHYLFRLFQRTDHVFNLLNVLFLMCISFLPFPTAVLSEYFTNTPNHGSAVSFYMLGLLLPAGAWSLLWFYGSAGYRLIDTRLDPPFVAFLSRQYALSPLFYFASFVLSFVNATAAIAVTVGLTLLYLLPPRAAVYRELPAED